MQRWWESGVSPARLSGKVALITGAARGQGRSHALTLAREGARLVLADICHDYPTIPYPLGTEEQLAATARMVREAGGEAVAVQCDVSVAADVERAAQTALVEFGRLDILVANASINAIGPCIELEEAQWDAMMDVNLKGVWLCCKYAARPMIAQRSGKIVTISSTLGVKVQPNLSHYIASKHGVIGLTRALAVELAPYNINVNTVMPGIINTDMTKSLSAPIA